MNSPIKPAFKLRSRRVASHQIPVTSLVVADFQSLLVDTLRKAPALFLYAPTILDLSALEGEVDPAQLEAIIVGCRSEKLIPYA
ncbi:hypothetical protein, partial [Reinekea sp.]